MMNRDVLRNGIQLAFYVVLITIDIILGSRIIEIQHQSEIVHQRIMLIADRALSK